MAKNLSVDRTIALLDILQESSDESHLLDINDLASLLAHRGIKAERKAIYRSLEAIRASGRTIHMVRSRSAVGYYMDHAFNMAEALLLCENLEANVSISREETQDIQRKIGSLLSKDEQNSISILVPPVGKNPESGVLETMQLLMKAIQENRCVDFYYYDLTINQKKNYRKQKTLYHLLPSAIASDRNRMYCVFWSDKYQGFANYRIDRMDEARICEDVHDPVHFDAESWMRSAFSMYAGEPDTIVITFDLSLAPAVYDQFGKDVIITQADDKTFTAAIRTAVTPTLTAWLMQFISRVTVEKPQSLIDELIRIADELQRTYNIQRKAGNCHE